MEVTGRGLIQVAGVILHREGRVLLQHRDDIPGIVWPGHWAIFGGHIEPGEMPHDAALREIAEELGLELEPPLELFHHGVHGGRERHIYVSALGVSPDTLVQQEGQGMALLSAEDLDTYPVVPAHREILERFFAACLRDECP